MRRVFAEERYRLSFDDLGRPAVKGQVDLRVTVFMQRSFIVAMTFLLLAAACADGVRVRLERASSEKVAQAGDGQEILTGWLHIVWNGKARYFVVDAQGRSTEVELDDSLAKKFGGPLSLNKKNVKIVGNRVGPRSERVRATSIELQ
ncbi:MAG: hypothetical protein HY695_35910 [Deltaproteobacteria bacterium]|nr:hypothetical protein [Deltaproteobacteria bacterium]